MVGVLVVSHGNLAKAMLECVDMLVGVPEQLGYVGIYPEDEPASFYKRLQEKASEIDTGEGIVALVDIFGGTPNNSVARLSLERNIRIITGMNLPMLLAVATERKDTTSQAELVDLLLGTVPDEIKEFILESEQDA